MNVKQPTLRVNTDTKMRNQLSSTKLDIQKVPGNSLVVHWLWCTFTAEGPGSTPGQGTTIPQAVGLGQKKSGGSLQKCNWLFQLQKNSLWSEGVTSSISLCWRTVQVPCLQQSISTREHILRVLSRTLKKTMIRLANLNPRIFNDSQTQLRHHSYEVPSKPAGHLRPECASLTTCTNDGKAKRQQGLLPNTLLFPGEAGSDPGLTPRCPDPLSQTFCFVRSKFLGRCLDSVWSLSRTRRVISNRNINFKST